MKMGGWRERCWRTALSCPSSEPGCLAGQDPSLSAALCKHSKHCGGRRLLWCESLSRCCLKEAGMHAVVRGLA